LEDLKFCKFCGEKIPSDAVICPKCGRQVEKLENSQTGNIVINNSNANVNTNTNTNVGVGGRLRNKYVALTLCILAGYVGFHKFYEGKIGMGLLYMCTCGLFCIGWFIDIFNLIGKPNPYMVY
jgi:restriction system protein